MAYLHKGLQGKIGIVKRRDGTLHDIFVYSNSSDFPENDIIIMGANGKFEPERIPLTEEMWQIIGECLGYRFRKVSEDKKQINQEPTKGVKATRSVAGRKGK